MSQSKRAMSGLDARLDLVDRLILVGSVRGVGLGVLHVRLLARLDLGIGPCVDIDTVVLLFLLHTLVVRHVAGVGHDRSLSV